MIKNNMKKNYAAMTTDEFLNDLSKDSDEQQTKSSKNLKSLKLKKSIKSSKTSNSTENGVMTVGVRQIIKNEKKLKDKEIKSIAGIKLHKKQLEGLKDIDPEFYAFLKQNDKKLLDFNLDDSDLDEEEEVDEYADDTGDGDSDEKKVHKPKDKMDVASDESDFHASDDEDGDGSDGIQDGDGEASTITLKQLRVWQGKLQANNVDIPTIRKVIQAFSSALASISGKVGKTAIYKVEGAAVFNGIVQLCVLHLQRAIYCYLGLKPKSNMTIHKCKKWKRIRSCLRNYLLDVTRLLEHVSSTNILTVLLKHLHQIGKMVSSFTTISKPILKRLIVLWSTSEETVRVLAFLCILKITRDQQVSLLNHVLKAMYLAYVRNSKFVSPNTLPGINFMRRSLVEMFALDLNVSYQHVFLYIRQLAIHLRNAIILKKKDSIQSVYNWQFINSIRLWSDLLGVTTSKTQLQLLIYPLISVVIGVIKLISTAQFFPLRFHCIQALINLSKQTKTFVPVLPLILEVLNSSTFNKKHTIVSMKPLQFTCVLRLNKSQLAENGFRDEVIENVCGMMLEYLAHESSSLAYPDLVVPDVVFLKQYLKNCKNSNYVRKLKQVLDKIVENSKFIEQERQKISFGLKDSAQIQAWETNVRNKGTPLNIYYASWTKTHETKRKRQAANTDDINDYDLPVIKRKRLYGKGESATGKAKNSNDGPVELFPSDSEDEGQLIENDDDGDIEIEKTTKSKKMKKDKKQSKKTKDGKSVEQEQHIQDEDNDEFVDDGIDIVKDLDLNDW